MNREQRHLLILPEDDANRQIANGFRLEVADDGCIRVLSEVRGWRNVLAEFLRNHQIQMRLYGDCHMVLLVDFDNQPSRRSFIERRIPPDLRARVFVLGVLTEPERLRADVSMKFEAIGRQLATECRDDLRELWWHPLLCHNLDELNRLAATVRPFLFDPD